MMILTLEFCSIPLEPHSTREKEMCLKCELNRKEAVNWKSSYVRNKSESGAKVFRMYNFVLFGFDSVMTNEK